MFISNDSQILIALSVLSSSFLGSLHCMGMCGPIVMVLRPGAASHFLYHLGRLIGYLLLAVLVSVLGRELISQFPQGIQALVTPFFLGTTFIVLGLYIFNNKRFHLSLPKWFNRPFAYAMSKQKNEKKNISSFIIGLFSITLPCGWVYGFVIGAAGTQSITSSMMIMFMFWLGTIPALIISPYAFQKVIAPLKEKFPYLAGIILMIAGSLLIYFSIKRVL